MRILSCLLIALLVSTSTPFRAQNHKPPSTIYHNGWIDLNKNGRMDVYENSKAPIDRRVDDLLRQMNLDEKTCQTATLYGVGRSTGRNQPPLKDELPTPDWKNQIWKD